MACLLRNARAHRRASLQSRALADRPEPPFPDGRDDDERRRIRDRLVRRRGHARRLPQRRARLERAQPEGDRDPHRVRPRLRAHPRGDRHRDPADELPSVPARQLALAAQRRDPRVPHGEARPSGRRRSLALRGDRGLDRHRDVLLPRAHLRARGRSAERGRARRSGSSRRRAASTASSTRSR